MFFGYFLAYSGLEKHVMSSFFISWKHLQIFLFWHSPLQEWCFIWTCTFLGELSKLYFNFFQSFFFVFSRFSHRILLGKEKEVGLLFSFHWKFVCIILKGGNFTLKGHFLVLQLCTIIVNCFALPGLSFLLFLLLLLLKIGSILLSPCTMQEVLW